MKATVQPDGNGKSQKSAKSSRDATTAAAAEASYRVELELEEDFATNSRPPIRSVEHDEQQRASPS